MKLPSTTERIYLLCPRCGSTGVCQSIACEEAGGSCYGAMPEDAALFHGAASCRDGYTLESCPFQEGHPRRQAWLKGYRLYRFQKASG
jgi:ribosome modulation factor